MTTKSESPIDAIIQATNKLHNHPWLTILAFLVITIVAMGSAGKLQINATPYMIDKEHPSRVADDQVKGLFTNSGEQAFIAVVNKQGDVFNAESLALISTLTQAFKSMTLVTENDAIKLLNLKSVLPYEAEFIDSILKPLVAKFSTLKIILEHITTKNAVDFVKQAGSNVAATITAHHLLFNRNHMLVGGIRPHFFCLPILKRNIHQQALIGAATSGDKKFFLGTDSAPHAQQAKEAACGCAGCYSAHAAIELYAEAFDEAGALDQLEAFASLNGPAFYQLPVSTDTITLTKKAWDVPLTMAFGGNDVVPVRAGEQIMWQVTK